MARLITKFKYLKPDERNHFGGYAEYIATREGVEKIDESRKFAPATDKQRRLIQKILADFPDSRSSLEYEDLFYRHLSHERLLQKNSEVWCKTFLFLSPERQVMHLPMFQKTMRSLVTFLYRDKLLLSPREKLLVEMFRISLLIVLA